MSAPPSGERIRRRAVVVAVADGRTELRWTESVCRGCVGCGGRCSLFAGRDDAALHLPSRDVAARPGTAVDVEIDGGALRRGATRAYGIAIAALLGGVALGHGVGRAVGLAVEPHAFAPDAASAANVGALLGLAVGTFLAGRLTKWLDAAPPLRVRPCPESDSHDFKELSR